MKERYDEEEKREEEMMEEEINGGKRRRERGRARDYEEIGEGGKIRRRWSGVGIRKE
jgi:hypothetical protein